MTYTILQDGAKQSGTFHFHSHSLYCINHYVLHVLFICCISCHGSFLCSLWL